MFIITDRTIAEFIETDPTPSGKYFFIPEEMPRIETAMRVMDCLVKADEYSLDLRDNRILPYWLVVGIAGKLAPKVTSLLVPNFAHPVQLPVSNRAEGTGSGPIKFSLYEGEFFTLVQFSCPRTLRTEELSSIIPPMVNTRKGVIISSHAPPWIVATVALAYREVARWVGLTQKRGKPVIAISSDPRKGVGTEIEEKDIAEAVKKAQANAIPLRGEIWIFDEGYGEHPGIIMSSEEDNRNFDDVMIMPATTKPFHAPRHVVVTPKETGLPEVSYAAYAAMTRLPRRQLVSKTAIGRATPELIAKLEKLILRTNGIAV